MECNVPRIPDSCLERGAYQSLLLTGRNGRGFTGVVLYYRWGLPKPSAANAFRLVLRLAKHTEDCFPHADLLRGLITLQQLAQCVFEKFQADGTSAFEAGAFKVETIVAVPADAAALAAAEGLVLKITHIVRVLYRGK